MALLLCLETSAKVCSVALFQDETLLETIEVERQNSHAETLLPSIDTCLNKAGISKKEIDAIVLSKGPGSYTGLRIGTSTAKGLCYALDIPLIAIETLSIAPYGIEYKDFERIISMQDARRTEVYTTVFDTNLKVEIPVHAKVMDADSFIEYKQDKVAFVGDGVEKCIETLAGLKDATFFPHIIPSAKYMGALAFQKWNNKKFEDVAYFTPFYLKEFKAGTPRKLV